MTMCLYVLRWIVIFLTCVNRCSASTSSIPDSSTILQLHELSTATYATTVSGLSSASSIITLPVSEVTTDSLLISPSKTQLLTTESADELSLSTAETSSSVQSGLINTLSSAEFSSSGNTNLSLHNFQSSTGISSKSFESSSGYSSRISVTKETADASTYSSSHSVTQTTEMNIRSSTNVLQGHQTEQTSTVSAVHIDSTSTNAITGFSLNVNLSSGSLIITDVSRSTGISTSVINPSSSQPTSTLTLSNVMISVEISTNSYFTSAANAKTSNTLAFTTTSETSVGMSTNSYLTSSANAKTSYTLALTTPSDSVVGIITNSYSTLSSNEKTSNTLSLTTISDTSAGIITNSYLKSSSNSKTSDPLALLTFSETSSKWEVSFSQVDKTMTDLSEVSTTRPISVLSTSYPIIIISSVVEHSGSVTLTEIHDHETSSLPISFIPTTKIALSSSPFENTSRDSNTVTVANIPTTSVHIEPSSTFVSGSKEVLKTISDSPTTYLLKSTPSQVNATSTFISSLLSSSLEASTAYVLKSTSSQVYSSSSVVGSLQLTSAETSVITTVHQSLDLTSLTSPSSVFSSKQSSTFSHSESSLADTTTSSAIPPTNTPTYIQSTSVTLVESLSVSPNSSVGITSATVTASSTTRLGEVTTAELMTSFSTVTSMKSAHSLLSSLTATESQSEITPITRNSSQISLLSSFSYNDASESLSKVHVLSNTLSTFIEGTASTATLLDAGTVTSSSSFTETTSALSMVSPIISLSTHHSLTSTVYLPFSSDNLTIATRGLEYSTTLSLSTHPPLTTSVDLPISTDNLKTATRTVDLTTLSLSTHPPLTSSVDLSLLTNNLSSAEYLGTLSSSMQTTLPKSLNSQFSTDTLGLSTSSVEYLTTLRLSTHAPFTTTVDNSLSFNTLIESTTTDEYLTHVSDSSKLASQSTYSHFVTSGTDTLRTLSTISDSKSKFQSDIDSSSTLSLISNSKTGSTMSTAPIMSTSLYSSQHLYVSTGIFQSFSAPIETSFTSLDSGNYTQVSSNALSIYDISRQSTSTMNFSMNHSGISSAIFESGIVLPTLPVSFILTTTKKVSFESLTTFLIPSTVTHLPQTSSASSLDATSKGNMTSTAISDVSVLHTTTHVTEDYSTSSHLPDISPTPSVSDVHGISNTTKLYSFSSFESHTNTIFSPFTSPFSTMMTSQELNKTSRVIVFSTPSHNITSILSSTFINISVSEPNSTYAIGFTTKHSSDLSMNRVSTVEESHVSSSSVLSTGLIESSMSSYYKSSVETIVTRHEKSFDSTYSLDSSLSHSVTSNLTASVHVTSMSSDYTISSTPTLINISTPTSSIVPTSSNLSRISDMPSSFELKTVTTPKYSTSSFQTETNSTTEITMRGTISDLFTVPSTVHPTSAINITSVSITMITSPLHNDTTLIETSTPVLNSSTRTWVTSVTQGEFASSGNTTVKASSTSKLVSTSLNYSEISTTGSITVLTSYNTAITSRSFMPNMTSQSVIHTVVNATSSFILSTSITPSSVNHSTETGMLLSSSLAAKPTVSTSRNIENSTISTSRSFENSTFSKSQSFENQSLVETSQVASMTTLTSSVIVKSASTLTVPLTLISHTTVISSTIAISSTAVLTSSEVISPSKTFSPTTSKRSSVSSIELTTSEKYTFSTMSNSTDLSSTSIIKTSTSIIPISTTAEVLNTTVSNTATSLSENSIIPSVTSDVSTSTSVTMTTSSVAPSTPEVPSTTELNATNAKETYWIRTVLKIQKTTDVSNPDFMRTTEEGLANAYNEAFIRERLIAEGKFEPFQKRRRKKRYTTVGEASIHVSDISRVGDSNIVNVVYAVEKAGQVLAAEQAVQSLAVLDKQELAIILKQVVDIRAETYVQSEKVVQPPVKAGLDLWLIGVIAGSVGGFLLIVFVVVCIYCKCCRHQEEQDSGDVELTSIHPQSSQRKMSRQLPSSQPKKPLVSQGSKFSLKNGKSYKLATPEITEVVPNEQMFLTTSAARKKGLQSSKSSLDASSENTPTLPRRELAPPTVKKARRNSKNSIGPSIDDMSNGSSLLLTSKNDPSQLFKSNVSEDSEDVKEQLKLEKKKNKERLRELYANELEPEVDDDVTARKELILGMSETAVPNVVIESGSPVKEPTNTSRRPSTVGNVPGEENLEEARTRMHKLLDDAFSLISPRNSFTENDLSEIRHLQEYAASKNSEHSSTQSVGEKMYSKESERKPLTADRVRDLLSGFVNPGYTSSYSNFLETWSPYRAADQVALIAMPNKPEPEVTKLGNKPRPSTSRLKGRPATNLELVNSKSTSQIDDKRRIDKDQESTFTTEAPKPIVLKTKDETPSARFDSAKSVGSLHSNQNRKFSNTSSAKDLVQNGNVTTIQNGNALTLSSHVQAVNSLLRVTREIQEPSRETRPAWKHREPEKHITNKDEVDVIQNIRPEEKTDNLIKSLKDELKSIKVDSEVDINKKPLKRKNRKHHSKPMTDIV